MKCRVGLLDWELSLPFPPEHGGRSSLEICGGLTSEARNTRSILDYDNALYSVILTL
jgi:hypothetical protein